MHEPAGYSHVTISNAGRLAPASTTVSRLQGVASLGYRGQLVEVDLTAVLPN